MGVHGLWKIVEPAHRPVKLETLARKRLAVDASIWIYQFLKAVRDKEGNALNNSHIVGFFRRICKLLFHGIKPVFVFDGGAPILKRQTIAGRKQRREGRREDATRTAARLLALQVKKRAEEEVQKRRVASRQQEEHEEIPEDAVYVDQLEQTPQQRKQTRKSRMTDQYQLPELEYDFTQLGAQNDVRLLTEEELKEYAKQFSERGEKADFEDLAHIDFDSPFFKSLPDADRYRILNNARLRSRLRMGYSKEQLDKMFPDRMAFSRFQIERVAKRNDLSQRVMNLQDGDKETVSVSRVAGEKGKEYILVRNDGPGGGWVMSFVGQQEGDTESKPIDVDKVDEDENEDSEEEGDFEDVPIEGLNRLPEPKNTAPSLEALLGGEARDLRRALYESRMEQGQSRRHLTSKPRNDEDEALFRDDNSFDIFGADEEVEVDTSAEDARIDADLQKAISMSLGGRGFQKIDMDDQDLQTALRMSMGQSGSEEKGKGRATATEASDNFGDTARPKDDFQKAIDELRMAEDDVGQSIGKRLSEKAPARPVNSLPAPLTLNSGSSFLMGKSMLGSSSKAKPALPKPPAKDDEPSIPLPPWFTGDISAAPALDSTLSEETRRSPPPRRAMAPTITLDAESSDEEDVPMEDVPIEVQGNNVLSMSDAADRIRAQPPKATPGVHNPPTKPTTDSPPRKSNESDKEIEWEASDHEQASNKITQTKSASPVQTSTNEQEKQDAENRPEPSISPFPSPPQPDDGDLEDFDISFDVDEAPPPEEFDLEHAEEVELLQQLAAEDEEHDRFAASLTKDQPSHEPPEPLLPLNQQTYDEELRSLRKQQRADLRDADEVSQTMIQECQSLLTLFGLPYITAPMEAEAQCAELVRLGLVDGIVTDDSDVFLFGGTRVFRYMFNDKQTVQCYLTSDLEKELALDRQRLISIAHLLGSDYTEGIPNIGPVTAIELLAEFPGPNGLSEFKHWWERVQKGIDTPSETASPFRKKLRKQLLTKVFIPPSFPDPRIDEAYLHPEVDSDPSPFSWGAPDLDGLREYLMTTLGWSRQWTDQVLVPVVRDMNRKLAEGPDGGKQVNITDYFGGTVGAGGWAPRVRAAAGSKRMEKAMRSLQEKMKSTTTADGGDDGQRDGEEVGQQEGTEEETVAQVRPMSMRERAALQAAEKEKEMAKAGGEDDDAEEEDEETSAVTTKKKGTKRKAPARRGRARKRAARS